MNIDEPPTGAARHKRRRNLIARELAERQGVSVRTVRRAIAEPRTHYLARVAARREQAAALRRRGLTHSEIAAEMGITSGTAGSLIYWARRHGLRTDPTPAGIAV